MTDAERRFGLAMLVLCAATLVLALAQMLTGDDAALGGPGRLAVGFCALMAGLEPRRHRPYALPIVLASVSGAVLEVGAGMVLWFLWDGLIGMGVLWLSESARRSVNGAVLRGGPPIG